MALRNDELSEIMARSRAERQALFGPVAEISRRLQPGHLVDVTTRYAKNKVSGVFGGVSNAIKENGGTAAAVALGAVAIFEAGRKSAEGGKDLANPTALDFETLDTGAHLGRVSIPDVETPRKAITNLARAKVLAGSAGGLFIGHVIGRSFEPTCKERELFGKVGEEVQNAAAEFMTQHSRGAKLAAAQAFGFARYSAGLLVLMAAVGDYFESAKDGGDQH
ncbi:hypothetical protein EJ076_33385 [Mesorhizobium sp. M7D.F.Ca.US.005.01.1.1]|jgi:hypothetical protein|uniref:hypothetical protein n=1 Tax=unclassified Mesorhizobium TaxID=325217 RepID=UPI000F76526B|nr:MULTISPECIES: hypothetical protein [unclassified Mesorhizobium]AZO45630.1 hypothetical protein EJ076_33385 [Mesorhizobium sp. M7D.F.Ca.US.005.01.1.1]RVA35947.1 hypothetical protein EN935_03285 [Mesorhizobium sp. M7D.F.Ca.US.004.03.1.1]